ncbi:hypothetical protein [Methylobacterium soli]|uniref:Uncharacterized protein n=1 Tax=Methylobacterium soli TaxID=553447 RepID=A0A6L3SYG3_9HYPH|nr:hypothetical protein [Methylobacterium soli]KAB1079090.1 hypothetical protein F6X53_11970 [Methylobacterium soli]GJE46279.1 hypothetical protein AEGHOMDF_5482 [Methylobacterium soli]
MANKRALSWSAALRDLKDDRSRRQDVREERLRTASGLGGAPALALSAWRGRSGKRYVVGVHALSETDLDEVGEAVVMAVRRDESGLAELVAVATAGIGADPSPAWLARAREAGASEMHVHRLAGTTSERKAIVTDLRIETADPARA